MATIKAKTVCSWLLVLALPLLAATSSQAQSNSEKRPSYYSEDYSGPEGPKNEPGKVAYLRIRLPANAQLWFNDQEKRTQKGATREFVTPALDPDRIYVYHIKARWTEEGGVEVQKTLRVRTIAGTRVTVNFVRPPESQPRPAAPRPIAASTTPARPVVRRPVDWTSGNVAPRSLNGPAGGP